MTSNRYDLNTAVSYDVTADEGFNKETHAELVKPLRERIVLNRDGIQKCYVSQYYIEVMYVSDVIDWSEVRQIVEEAIKWATTNVPGMFPLRGDKVPAIVKRAATTRKTTRASVIGRYTTSTIAYLPSRTEKNKYDSVQAAREQFPLARQLTARNGVLDYAIGSDGVRLDFDTTYVSVEAIKAHITEVLKASKRPASVRVFWAILSKMTWGRVSRRDYFPYIENTRDLEIVFEVRENE